MLCLELQPRVVRVPMVGTNLKMQQLCIQPCLVVNPVQKDSMPYLKVQLCVVRVLLVGTDLLQQLRMDPLVVNPVEKDFMLHLKVQPRVVRVPLVGNNL